MSLQQTSWTQPDILREWARTLSAAAAYYERVANHLDQRDEEGLWVFLYKQGKDSKKGAATFHHELQDSWEKYVAGTPLAKNSSKARKKTGTKPKKKAVKKRRGKAK